MKCHIQMTDFYRLIHLQLLYRISSASQIVSKTFTDRVNAPGYRKNTQTWKHKQPEIAVKITSRIINHHAPVRCRRLNAKSKKTK